MRRRSSKAIADAMVELLAQQAAKVSGPTAPTSPAKPAKPASKSKRKPKTWQPAETEIVKGILTYLRWSKVLAWRQNTGGFEDDAGNHVRFGIAGTADILGIVRDGPHRGRFVAIEVKRPGLDRKPKQEIWHRTVLAAGAISILAHSVIECQMLLEAELAKPPLCA